MNILFCSAGRRAELLKYAKKSLSPGSRIVATDMSIYAPAIYIADKHYIVPSIYDPKYIEILLSICEKEKINVITTLIDPEIEILAKNRQHFENLGIVVLAPYTETAKLCFDKYLLYKYLVDHGIATAKTYGTFSEAEAALVKNEISLPVFVKPRRGSGSVGARKVCTLSELQEAFSLDPLLIVQEYMNCVDMDADVYVDTISHQPVSIFTKRKLETKIGGASKTISFKDQSAVDFIVTALKHFEFNGPIDVDLFYKDGKYYLSEINPRFGGAYLHAYGAGVDFMKLIENNACEKENLPDYQAYDENVVMMMYDSVVIEKIEQ